MKQLRAEASASENTLAPIVKKATGDAQKIRPDFRFNRSVIESWLRKSYMLDADATTTSAITR